MSTSARLLPLLVVALSYQLSQGKGGGLNAIPVLGHAQRFVGGTIFRGSEIEQLRSECRSLQAALDDAVLGEARARELARQSRAAQWRSVKQVKELRATARESAEGGARAIADLAALKAELAATQAGWEEKRAELRKEFDLAGQRSAQENEVNTRRIGAELEAAQVEIAKLHRLVKAQEDERAHDAAKASRPSSEAATAPRHVPPLHSAPTMQPRSPATQRVPPPAKSTF